VRPNIRVRQHTRREDGYTLLELLMAVTIAALIVGALGFSITEGYQNATTSKSSIDRSLLGNFTARYFSADVASAVYGASAIVTTSPPACGTVTQTIIDIQTGPQSVVSYAVTTEADGRKTFVRRTCTGTVSGALTLPHTDHLGTTDNNFVPSVTCTTTSNNTNDCSMKLTWATPAYVVKVNGSSWVNATTTVAP
jgi:prepilin-type N-terminal cleavage/methylation domain-containing protein